MGTITKDNPIFRSMFNEYCTPKSFELSRLKTDFIAEIKTRNEYQGREIYELIQNADDQDAKTLFIQLDSGRKQLNISNDGNKPFSEEGYCSIMLPDSSPKIFAKLIGQKGLGFRSILNWSNSVSIISNGVRCDFSPEWAKSSWDEIKGYLSPDVVEKLEKLSEKKNRNCPIPILSIPHVENEENGAGIAAEIIINYSDDSRTRIEEQLNSLNPQVLLFLRSLKRIEIIIDGNKRVLEKGEDCKDSDGIKQIKVSGEDWILLEVAGRLYPGVPESNYQVSVAYRYGGIDPKANYVYCFFPTKVPNPYNCVIHATFELNQSRKEILDNDANKKLFSIIGQAMVELATYVAKNGDKANWEPYSIVALPSGSSNEIVEIENCLKDKIGKLQIYPTISGRYVSFSDFDNVSEKFAGILQRIEASSYGYEVFANHLLPVPSNRYFIPFKCSDLVEKLNSLSPYITDVEQRAELIYELAKNSELFRKTVSEKHYPHLLVNDDNEVIEDCGYLNTGDKIPNIPSFINFHYVNEELTEKLKGFFSVSRARSLCEESTLKGLLDINYCDRNTVIAKVLPTSEDDISTAKERIKCLYEYFLDSGDIASDTLTERVKLPNAAGGFSNAEEIVLFEKEYPDGVERLNIDVDPKWRLASPKNWDIKVDDWSQYERFWVGIGVSLYIPKEKRWAVSDRRYLETNGVRGGELDCYSSLPKEQRNFARVPISDFLHERNLMETLCLLYKDLILRNSITSRGEERFYYHNKRIFSRVFKNSYVSYYLQNNFDSIRKLKGYVLSVDVSPEGVQLDYDYFRARNITSREMQSLVSYLGAVEDAEDLSVEQLYKILEIQPLINKDGFKIQRIYSLIKKALISKSEAGQNLSIPSGIKLFARRTEEEKGEYLPRREVYYWDNDCLPKSFLKDKPKLEIGHRVGEDQVKTVFGVKLPKDDNVCVIEKESERNHILEESLYLYIQRRMDYILAFRVEDINDNRGFNAAKLALNGITFHCYKKCSFISGDSKEHVLLGSNEMVITRQGRKSVFNICHINIDIDSAFRNPEFCEAITEAIAITMRLKTDNSEFLDAVSTILMGDERMNTFFIRRKLGYEAATILKRFSQKVVKAKYDNQAEIFNQLLILRSEYLESFKAYIYEEVKDSIETQKTFKDKILAYNDQNLWLEELSRKITVNDDINEIFDKELENRFGVGIEVLAEYEHKRICQRSEYDTMLDGIIHMTNEDISLTFFAGNEKLISQFHDKYSMNAQNDADNGLPQNPNENPDKSLAPQELNEATWVDSPRERFYSSSQTELSSMQSHHSRLSAKQASQSGEDATNIVIESMKLRKDLYGFVGRVDESGDKAAGTDAHHYDIEFFDKKEGRLRYLEVKSLQGNECKLTPMEYMKGKTCPEDYDIAFVKGGKPYIMKKPFLDDRFKECIWATEYTINVVNLKFGK